MAQVLEDNDDMTRTRPKELRGKGHVPAGLEYDEESEWTTMTVSMPGKV
jgi:hypothetical protein